jgi:AcrR family transcriptional regulator
MPRTKETFEAMRETTRRKIEAAALSLFARNGLSVKVGEIAGAAGVSQGLLYSHYWSKDALIAELIRQATDISGRSVKEIAVDGGTAAAKIKRITNMMCGMLTGVSPVGIDYFMFMVQVGLSGFGIPEASRHTQECPNPVDSLARVIVQGQTERSVAPGNQFGMSVIYWAAIQGLCCYAASGSPVSPEQKVLNRILLKEEYL